MITILFSPLSLLFFSFLRPRGMISAKEGGEGRKKERKRSREKGEKGYEGGIWGIEREQDFYIKCHDSATLTGETMWRCLKYCSTLRYQTRWRGGRKKWKGKKKGRRGERERERTMRREKRERERRGSRSYCNNMEVCHEFDESSKKIVQPTRKSTPLLLLSIVSSRRCFCQISIFL